jgi:hypothetical protein
VVRVRARARLRVRARAAGAGYLLVDGRGVGRAAHDRRVEVGAAADRPAHGDLVRVRG